MPFTGEECGGKCTNRCGVKFSAGITKLWREPFARVLPEDNRNFFKRNTRIVSGQHSWRKPKAQVDFAFDVNLMYLSGFDCYIQSGMLYQLPEIRTFNPERPGFWDIVMPKWTDERIPHPAGISARPGERQWVTTSTLELLFEMCGPLRIHDNLLGHGSFVGKKPLNRKLQAYYKERIAIDPLAKNEYKHGIGKIAKFTPNETIIFRPDINYYVRSTANAKLWRKAYQAVQLGHELVLFTKIDTIGFRGKRGSPSDWPSSFRPVNAGKVGTLKPCRISPEHAKSRR